MAEDSFINMTSKPQAAPRDKEKSLFHGRSKSLMQSRKKDKLVKSASAEGMQTVRSPLSKRSISSLDLESQKPLTPLPPSAPAATMVSPIPIASKSTPNSSSRPGSRFKGTFILKGRSDQTKPSIPRAAGKSRFLRNSSNVSASSWEEHSNSSSPPSSPTVTHEEPLSNGNIPHPDRLVGDADVDKPFPEPPKPEPPTKTTTVKRGRGRSSSLFANGTQELVPSKPALPMPVSKQTSMSDLRLHRMTASPTMTPAKCAPSTEAHPVTVSSQKSTSVTSNDVEGKDPHNITNILHLHTQRLHMPKFSVRNHNLFAGLRNGIHQGDEMGLKPRKGSITRLMRAEKHDPMDDHGPSPPRPPPRDDDEADPENERDQYGFRKTSQWLSIDDFHQFEQDYQPILDRRAEKWAALLRDVPEGQLPARSEKVKRYVRKGIPPHLRGRAWFHYSGAETLFFAHPGEYAILVSKAEELGDANEFAEVIDRDLHRTFPENIKFKSTTENSDGTTTLNPSSVSAILSLRRVLVAFSIYSPAIGYCQSLNYIAGLLLLFMDEEEAFWTLVTIIHDYLPSGMYDVRMEGANIDQAVLMSFLEEKLPNIWQKLAGGTVDWDGTEDMPTITLVTSHWFLTLFINVLPVETVLRVWDCFFYEGNKVLFRVALAIFKMYESRILTVDDSLEVFQVVQNVPKRILDCHRLMEFTFRRSDITRHDIERKRVYFRERRRTHRRELSGDTSAKRFGKQLRRQKGLVSGLVDRAKTVKKL
ncbi:hypothetical protein BZG36_01289 [Bifiguratus adelaidae]|uniref:Rab-GAP TBC domain-containing protein n=1 Tax=Bifiguratus adelaidae TaxID=1938954 RepID=A0A261Y555_9FUNG|nr:hypothetical protein BZG36_01289 [Bifiguratus adelaidae]